MTKEVQVVFGMIREQYHPVHKRVERAKWIGYYHHYSQWEFLSDGYVTLGEPLLKG